MLGLARGFRQPTSLLHRRLGLALQHRVGGQIDDVLHFRFAIQKIQNFRGGKTAIQSHPNAGLRKSFLHSDNQAAQDPNRARRPGGISRTQHGRHQILLRLLVKAQKTYHRQIAVSVIVAIEEGQLLGAVGRIVGRIQIDRDTSGSAPQTTAMPFDHAVGQRFAHAKQLFAIPAIFKARQGRLRSQVFALDRIATHQQLVYRIGTQPGRIVGIRIPASDGHHPLGDQFHQLMLCFACLPLILQSLGESGRRVGTQDLECGVGLSRKHNVVKFLCHGAPLMRPSHGALVGEGEGRR